MTEQATNDTADEQQPQFFLQRVYLRGLSFESSRSPKIFRQEWNPSTSPDLNTRQKQLDGGPYKVVLTVLVTVKNGEDTTAFITEVQQTDVFLIENLDPSSMSHTLDVFHPNVPFPCTREALDSLVVRGLFPALMLSLVNFDALYAQEIARMQASGEIPTPSAQ